MSKTASASTTVKKLKALWSDNRSWKQRLPVACAAMLAPCFTFLFFGPLEMIAFGGNAMSYTWQSIWWILALAALAVFLISAPLLSLLRGKVFHYTVNVIFCMTLCGYLQAALMNGSLGILNGDAVDWHLQAGAMAANLLAWVLIIVAGFFVLYLNRKLWTKAVTWICLILVVMQLASTFSIVLTGNQNTGSISDYNLTDSGMYAYGDGNNIFVFVLDRLDYDYITEVLREDPAFFKQLDGFTGYTNATSAYARTQPALNHILTGSETAYFCSREEFYRNSWTEDGKDLLGGLKARGYSVELYTTLTYLFSDVDFALDRVDNISKGQSVAPLAVLPKLMRLSAYRYSPIAAKPFFWADTNYYNEGVFSDGAESAYQFNDAGYAPGFVTATAQRSGNCFKFYHFYGSHSPYTMNADGTASEESTSAKAQTMGSFRNLFAAFAQMKQLGIYEDATIIITADHGSAVSDQKPVQKATRIGLFYKPSGSSDAPFTWSDAPVCTDNISATIAKAAGLDNAPLYGTALEDVANDPNAVRYYYKSQAVNGSSDERTVYRYEITGDAADFNHWKIVETTEEIPEENSFY